MAPANSAAVLRYEQLPRVRGAETAGDPAGEAGLQTLPGRLLGVPLPNQPRHIHSAANTTRQTIPASVIYIDLNENQMSPIHTRPFDSRAHTGQ